MHLTVLMNFGQSYKYTYMKETDVTVTDSINWRVDGKVHSLSRIADFKNLFVYQRGDSLPQFFNAPEAQALAMQIRRMVDRSDFAGASKRWGSK